MKVISEESDAMRPDCPDCGVLTMAFVNIQPLEQVYEVNDAFCSGSLFPELDKPLMIGGRRI